MADIQFATAEIRQGKKKKIETGQKYNAASAMQGGHNKAIDYSRLHTQVHNLVVPPGESW